MKAFLPFMLFCLLSVPGATKTTTTLNRAERHDLQDRKSIRTILESNFDTTFSESRTGTTYTTSTHATLTEATVPPHDSRCYDTVTDFAYQHNFCAGAQDPESYLDLARSRYSCLNRCGQAPKYGERFSECGCDASCAAYKDCCRDVVGMCPELHKTENVKDLYAAVERDFRICADYALIHRDGILPSPVTPKMYPAYTSSMLNREQVLPFKPRNLIEISEIFSYYKLIEKNSKLIFEDYITYLDHNLTNPNIYFIPKVVGLTCFYNSTETAGSHSIFHKLPWCRVMYIKDLLTHYHRPCKKNQILTCRCKDGNFLKDHVHNACLDQKSQTRFFRHKLWDKHVENSTELPSENEKCLLHEISSVSVKLLNDHSNEPSNPDNSNEQKNDIKLRISPVSSQFQMPQMTLNDEVENDEIWIQKTLHLKQGLKIHFIVELSKAMERRFYCPSLLSRLQDCWLVECAEGGILWTGHLSNGQLARRSCIVPARARVLQRDGFSRVPFCTCFNVVAALNDLKIWKITLDSSQATQCSLILETSSTYTRPLDETYEYTDQNSFLPEHPVSANISDKSVFDGLEKRLARIDQLCPEDENHIFQICFFSTGTAGDDYTMGQKCLLFGAQDVNGSFGSFSIQSMFFFLQILWLIAKIY